MYCTIKNVMQIIRTSYIILFRLQSIWLCYVGSAWVWKPVERDNYKCPLIVVPFLPSDVYLFRFSFLFSLPFGKVGVFSWPLFQFNSFMVSIDCQSSNENCIKVIVCVVRHGSRGHMTGSYDKLTPVLS